jgi:NTE family protein
MEKHKNIVNYETLVLSGHSIKGLVVLGSIQYLYDNFLLNNIKTFIGTSSGSIICYLLIIGYTPIEIMVYICTNQLFEKMQNFNIVAMMQRRGAMSFNNIQEHLEKMTIAKLGYLPTLKNLKDKFDKKLICVTYNLTKKQTEYLNFENNPDLPCIIALRMSANLPLLFESYKYGDSLYIDGGISDNFAIDIDDKDNNKIIGILLNCETNKDINTSNTMEFIYNLLFIPVNQSINLKINNSSKNCQVIKLDYDDKIKIFDFNIKSTDKLQMFTNGYKQISDILNI